MACDLLLIPYPQIEAVKKAKQARDKEIVEKAADVQLSEAQGPDPEFARALEMASTLSSEFASIQSASFRELTREMLTEFDALTKRLQRVLEMDTTKPTRPIVILVLDEAHTLANLPQLADQDSGDRRDAHGTLQHVLSFLNERPLFTVLLSTNTNVQTLAPPSTLHPSWRAGQPPKILAPSFTELPFDIFAENLYGRITLEAACSPEIVMKFGRPL